MCYNEVGILLKKCVHSNHTVNCNCCLYVCVSVFVFVCTCALRNKRLCMCAIIQNTQGKTLKQSQKRSNLAIDLCVRRNDRGSCDKRFLFLWSSGQHSFVSTSTCDPIFLFLLIYCLPLDGSFISFQMYQFLTLVPLRLALRVVSCGCLSDVSRRSL